MAHVCVAARTDWSLSMTGYFDKGKLTKRERFLAEMEQVVPWARLCALIDPHYPKGSPAGGRPPLLLERMFRIYCLQQWYSIATPLASESVRFKWFDFPRTLGLMLLPAASAAAGLWAWTLTARMKRGLPAPEWGPFAGAVAIYVLAFPGLAYSLFPYVVIDRITIWDAAAHPSALMVMLIGALIVLPFIVGYTVFSYRVFRGKASENLYD